ncbi:MAG: mannitol dehydrogenase family protein [Actinomycetota bacterium]|nr:mannitol dehydrogenase family protein [Actinomycetota bacterium]
MTQLDACALSELAGRVAVPSYDRGGVRVGIVHFGVGGFARSHLTMYVDRLMEQGLALEWGVCGVGVLPSDRRMQEALDPQDGLYTLVVKSPDGGYDARVVASLMRYLFAPDDPEAVVETMADPATRIVSLTITEGGYNIDAVTGEFVRDDPAIQRDLTSGAPPATVFGLVTEALARRRDRGVPPFAVMSCDNVQHNGQVARGSFATYAEMRDPELGAWVRSEVSFPDSMVDRITPVTTDGDRAELARRFGVEDRWPVVCEPFTQWVLEDAFPLGRPPFEQAGVQLVEHVEPYELMKLRLLNASHQALAYFAHLCGYRLVHEACQDPLFARFLLAYMDREGRPTLAPVPGVDLPAYMRQLVDRFSNPEVRDTVARLAAETSDRIPKWLLPVVRHNLAHGGEVHRAAAAVASWARYAEGVDEQGQPIQVVDRLAERLTATARRWPEEPLAFVGDRELFGDLADNERFTAAYLDTLTSLHERGARATLEALGARDA